MNLLAVLDMARYSRSLAWVMLAGCAARFSAERSGSEAMVGFLLWAVAIVACSLLRASLASASDARTKLEKAGNVVAALGLLLFVFRLSVGIVPALLTLLLATQLAMFVAAEKRLHVLLILAAAFCNLLFAAAESRSALFLISAAWFTLAALSVLSLDVRLERESAAVTKPLGAISHRSGHAMFTTLVLLIAVPLYLFVPKPAGLMLGGMKAQTAHDYRDEQERRSDGDIAESDAEPDAEPGPADGALPQASDTEGNHSDAERVSGENFDVSQVQRDRTTANHIVMYVKSSQPVNLRGKIYDRFAGNRWHRNIHDVKRHALSAGNWERTDARGSTPILQTVEVVADIDNVLVHAAGLARLRFPAPSIREYDDGVFELPRAIKAETTYSVESRVDVFEGRYVDVSSQRKLAAGYLLVPDDVSDRVRQLAQQVTENLRSVEQKATALESYLRENYRYSFDTIEYQGYTPIDWFLFEGKRGHCEYFASALAVMLRTIGIPSRLATGFSLGERNPMTGYYEVRAMNGHAWVEAYVPDRGWMMLEPTPFYPLPVPETQSQVARELDRYLDRLAQERQTVDPESLPAQAIEAVRDGWSAMRHASRWITEQAGLLGWWLPFGLVTAVICAALTYLLWQLRADVYANRQVQLLLARQQDANKQAAVLATATALELAAASRGFERQHGMTMRSYIARLHALDPATPQAFAEMFDAARYSDELAGENVGTLGAMAHLIEGSIARNPQPRLARTWASWKAYLASWLPRR